MKGKTLAILCSAAIVAESLCSCTRECGNLPSRRINVRFEQKAWNGTDGGCGGTRSSINEEVIDLLSDVNIFTFKDSSSGYVYDLSCSGHFTSLGDVSLTLDESGSYRLFAFANAGKDLTGEPAQYDGIDDFAENFRFAITDYRSSFDGLGLPLSGVLDVQAGYAGDIVINLTRLYSRWLVKINTDELSYSKLQVKSLKIENAPTAVYPFSAESRSRNADDSTGEDRADCAGSDDLEALSEGRGIYLYILENMQGRLLENWQEKIPSSLESNGYGSMVEDGLLTSLKMEVAADTPWATYENVCFRTYLGENTLGDFNILRNTPRNLTLHMCSDRISESEWKIEPGTPSAEFSPKLEVTLKSHLNTNEAWVPYIEVKCIQCEKLADIYGDFLSAVGVSLSVSSQHTAKVIYRNKFQWQNINSNFIANGGQLSSDGYFTGEYVDSDGYIRSSYYSNECELVLTGYERSSDIYSSRDGDIAVFHPCDNESVGDADSFLTMVDPSYCAAYKVFTESYERIAENSGPWYWEWVETDYIGGHNTVFVTVTVDIPQRILSGVQTLYGKDASSFINYSDKLEAGWPYKTTLANLGYIGVDWNYRTTE